MSEFIDVIRNRPYFYAEKGASALQIEQAEKLLELSFALDFKECLYEFGAVSVDGHDLTGFSADKYLDVVNITLSERENNPDVPKDWYVIEQANIDGIVIWQNQKGEIYQTQPCKKIIKIANSIVEYIASEHYN